MSLADVVARSAALPDADVGARLAWLEESAAALEADADLGPVGPEAALQLRAALGAVVKWTQGPRDPASLVELDLLVRTLTARGLLLACRAAADAYAALSEIHPPQRAACLEAATAFRELADAVRRGVPPAEQTLERLRAVQRSLPAR